MNKTEFINQLQLKTGYSNEQCVIINQTLEQRLFFRKKNKTKTVNDLVETLSVTETEAEKIYEIATEIIKTELDNVKRHPFGSRKKKYCKRGKIPAQKVLTVRKTLLYEHSAAAQTTFYAISAYT